MSSNIYDDPDLTMNIKYSRGEDRRERLERVVDIYETLDMCTDQQVDLSTHNREPHAQKHLLPVQRNWLRALALILGLLCLLLGAVLAVLCIFYMTSVWKEEQLHIKNKNLTSKLERINCQLGKANQTQGNTTEWKRFKCTCYYISTEKKNWTESRKDCKKSGADLVMLKTKTKHDFFKELNVEFWIGLESKNKTKGWSVQKEWKWMDGSSLIFGAWKTGVNSDPERGFKAYMDAEGTWMHTNSGSKHWICERDIS
ncbi:natural killer cells antigen CD94-like [Archocentrus centrarchus]|uniref:natural killer cells antigen CD94-like n=1 Tax=Archocentrus centrarchus TaxID=63155 RepID=UPI0011EA374D|nr:natural killer cells antigen CD94-like [Archocentrus centrarchus]